MTVNVILHYFVLEYHMRLFTYMMAMIILTFFLNADTDAVFWALCGASTVINISPELNTDF